MLTELKGSHLKEKEILRNCMEFQNNMNENAQKIKAVMQIAQEDSQVVTELKKELEQAQHILQVLREKDEQSAKKIENLQKIQKHLEELIKKNQEKNSEKIKEYEKITKQKNELELQISLTGEKNGILQGEFDVINIKNIEKEKMLSELKKQNRTVTFELKETVLQINKSEERLMEIHLELIMAQEKRDFSYQNLDEEKISMKNYEKKLEKIFEQVKKIITRLKVLKKQNLEIEKVESKNNEKLSQINEIKNSFIQERYDLERDILNLQKETNLQNLECKQKRIIKTSMQLEEKKFLDEKAQVEEEIRRSEQLFEEYFQKLKQIREETKPIKHQLQELYFSHEELMKQFQVLSKANKISQEQINSILNGSQRIQKQLQPCQGIINEKTRALQIEKQEKEKIIKDINHFHCKRQKIKEDLLLKDNIINEVQKKSLETENQLINLQQQYESVRVERNNYSKQLKDTKDETSELERKINITLNFLDQMQEEFQVKSKEAFSKMKESEEKNKKLQIFNKENEKLRNMARKKEENIKHIINNISKLKGIQQEIELEINHIINQSQQIMTERDLMVTQLIEFNEEHRSHKEKNEKQLKTYINGEKEFNKKESELLYLNILFSDLQNEIQINKMKTDKIFKYQQKIKVINDNLKIEKLKVKALSEELENPININRWRSVNETQDDVFELIQNIQNVQKNLIRKTEAIIQEDLKISGQKKTLKNFQEIYKQNPGVKEALKLSDTQKQLKKKIRKLKSCAAELNLYKFKINQGKEQYQDFRVNIENYKKKIFGQLVKEKNLSKIGQRKIKPSPLNY